MVQQIREKPREILPAFSQIIELAQSLFGITAEHGFGEGEDLALRRQSEHRKDVRFFNGMSAEADQLIERAFGVAHSTVGAAADRVKGCFINLHLLLRGNRLE